MPTSRCLTKRWPPAPRARSVGRVCPVSARPGCTCSTAGGIARPSGASAGCSTTWRSKPPALPATSPRPEPSCAAVPAALAIAPARLPAASHSLQSFPWALPPRAHQPTGGAPPESRTLAARTRRASECRGVPNSPAISRYALSTRKSWPSVGLWGGPIRDGPPMKWRTSCGTVPVVSTHHRARGHHFSRGSPCRRKVIPHARTSERQA